MSAPTAWIDRAPGRASLLAIYGAPPAVDDVYLHEVRLHQDGPHLTLRFDLKTLPTAPPPSWEGRGYNVVQVTYELWGVEAVEVRGFATQNHVALTVARREDDKLDFAVASLDPDGTSIRGVALTAIVQKVSPYLKDASGLADLAPHTPG